jgi:nucleoside-diphosphate-sugar epimerase
VKILVVGSHGFIGKNLVDYLIEKGYQIKEFEGDIRDINNCAKNFIDDDFDAVIDLVAYGNNSRHLKNNLGVDLTIETNLIGTLNLARCFLNSKAKTFIYTGSSSEYGSINKQLSTSTKPSKKGQNFYSVTKNSITNLLLDLNNITNKKFKVLRLFTVYGKREPENHLIPTLLRAVLSKETVGVSPGSHDFVYIKDVCRAIEKLIKSKNSPEISHAATGKQYTNLQVLKIIEKVVGRKLFYYDLPKMYDYDRKNWVSDKKSILIKPRYTLEQGLREWLNLKK